MAAHSVVVAVVAADKVELAVSNVLRVLARVAVVVIVDEIEAAVSGVVYAEVAGAVVVDRRLHDATA